MPSFYNTKEEFGMCGPFEAPSKESLADEMEPTFREWAEEKFQRDDEATLEFKVEYIAASMEQMRREFIAGLEEQP